LILSLAGCGRKAGLDAPPSAAVPGTPTAQSSTAAPSTTAPDNASHAQGPPGMASIAPTSHEDAQKNGFDSEGNPVAGPGQKKTFPLDFLLQ